MAVERAVLRRFLSRSPEATEALGAAIGRAVGPGAVLALEGDLGAGKTCFVRGLARGLGCDAGAVRSPSFTLLLSYGGRRTLRHYDAYFTEAAVDLERAGLVESLAAGDVVAVEWGERFERWLPADRLTVKILHLAPERRRLDVAAAGPSSRGLLGRALPAAEDKS